MMIDPHRYAFQAAQDALRNAERELYVSLALLKDCGWSEAGQDYQTLLECWTRTFTVRQRMAFRQAKDMKTG